MVLPWSTVTDQGEKRILVKHSSTYTRIHTFRITYAAKSNQTEIQRTNHNYRNNSGNNESKSNQLKSRSTEIDSTEIMGK